MPYTPNAGTGCTDPAARTACSSRQTRKWEHLFPEAILHPKSPT